jgi:hypothetical protein
LIEFKARLLNANVTEKDQHKNAYGKKKLYFTIKTVSPRETNKIKEINNLTIEDLFLWLLDDGSYHKKDGFLNLNSHALTRAENMELSFHLWHSLGIETRLRHERKKDGRLFWYIYIPCAQVDSLKAELMYFMVSNNIVGLEYKIGATPETIHNGVGPKLARKGGEATFKAA